jgi:hypothetical protein
MTSRSEPMRNRKPLPEGIWDGASERLTTTLTATSADDGCGSGSSGSSFDRLALEAEPYVGVDAGGDADVGPGLLSRAMRRAVLTR